MKKVLFLLLTAIVVFSCSDDDGTESAKINKQLVDLNLKGSTYEDFWLVATNMSGEVLDYKQWKGEDHLILNGEVSADEKINILMISKWVAGTLNEQNLNIYTDLELGREWMDPGIDWQSGPRLGEGPKTSEGNFNVSWTNAPAGTNNYQNSIQASGGAELSTLYCAGECTFEYAKYASPATTLFYHVGNVSTPVYFESDDLEVGGNYTFDFNDVFKPFDNIITIDVKGGEQSQIYFGGIENTTFHPYSSYWFFEGGDLKFGYNNDGYDHYLGFVSCSGANAKYTFNVYKPSLSSTDFEFPTEDFTILDENFSNFSFSVQWDKHFVYQNSRYGLFWKEGEIYHWVTVNLKGDRSGPQVIHQLPQEIVSAFPKFADWNTLPYQQSNFLFVDDDINYQEWLESRFGKERESGLRSYYWITK